MKLRCLISILLSALGPALFSAEAPPPPAQAPGNWEARDYDALYALLEKYREEIRALGLDKASLSEQLKALQERDALLQKKIDGLLLPKDGLKIHGRVLGAYDDVLVIGPGRNAGVSTRYRHAIGRAVLDFSGERGPFSAIARLDMQNLLGNAFGASGSRLGFRKVGLELRTPLSVQLGNFQASLSPLTLWRNEDEFPYESEMSKRRRARLREDLELQGNAWMLGGLRLSTEFVSGESLLGSAEALAAPLGYAGAYAATLGGADFNAIYNTYLGAWRLKSAPLGGLTLSYQGSGIMDAMDSRAVNYGAGNAPEPSLVGHAIQSMDSQVHAAELKAHWGGFEADLEAARSLYANPNDAALYNDPVIGHSGYLSGTAFRGGASWMGSGFSIQAEARVVDAGFKSPASQGRSQDPANFPLGPFPTENTLFNPSTGRYGAIGVPEAPLSAFSSTLLPPNLISPAGGIRSDYLLAYDRDVNPIFPYGPSTPNRSGGLLGLGYASKGGAFRIRGDLQSASEISGSAGRAPEAMLGYGAGLWLDLDKAWAWPLSLSAGYTSYDERNGEWLAYDSTMLELGLNWQISKRAVFMLSGRHLDANGTLPYTGSDPLVIAKGRISSKHQLQNAGAGLEIQLNESTQLILSYDGFWFMDPFNLDTAGSDRGWEASQAYARVAMLF